MSLRPPLQCPQLLRRTHLREDMTRNENETSRFPEYSSQLRNHSSDQITTRLLTAASDGADAETIPTGDDQEAPRKRFSKAATAVFFLTTISPKGIFSRKHLTEQIQKLCRHDETTIFQRHGTHLSVDRLTESDKIVLHKLCKKQLEFSQTHRYVMPDVLNG